jgi:hypothetical protein
MKYCRIRSKSILSIQATCRNTSKNKTDP